MIPKPPYPQYACPQGNPLTCTEDSEKGSCSVCQFPGILSAKSKINGQNQYEIVEFLGQRGNGRLYEALNLSDQSDCVLKEYVLPEQTFNSGQMAERREAFIQRSGISLADGRAQNFRLVMPIEAIVSPLSSSERYFLVYGGEYTHTPSLKQFLENQSPLSVVAIRNILSQILQSLEFMHQQQFRWISGQVQAGLLHGNLNLDSVLVAEKNPGLLVYLCDFYFWESLFTSPFAPQCRPAIARDLQAVGSIAKKLTTASTDMQPPFGATLVESQIKPELPLADQHFIQRLTGESDPPFETSEQARQVLLSLPPVPPLDGPFSPVAAQKTIPTHPFRWWMGLILVYFFIGSVGIGWLYLRNQTKHSLATEHIPCCIDQVANVPTGPVQFMAEKQGTWDFLYTQPHLLKRNTTLQRELNQAQVLLQSWQYQPLSVSQDRLAANLPEAYGQKVMALLNGDSANFFITNHADDIDPSFGVKPFAYNGIGVFVAFGYAQRENSLPRRLKGKITLQQLRGLYTGQIKNWREIGGPDRPVKVYFPDQDGLLRIFERQVLVDESSIAAFRKRIATQGRTSRRTRTQTCVGSFCGFTSTTLQLRAVIEDFEDRDAFSIGFDELNKVVNQCSVYPLALAEKGKSAISPFRLNNNRPVTPTTDLCNSKASYSVNDQALQNQTYPLTFSLNVVYARDNRRQPAGQTFANILKTQETQCWLQQIGLVPFRKMSTKSACRAKPKTEP